MKTAREIIENYDGPDVRIMEVCGTHTHEIFRLGIRKLLPKQVELISGPGCPVCVTPVSFIDEAIYLALEKGVTICTFGDLVRVPGTNMSLAGAREQGAKIHVVYSPADAEKYAGEHPDEQVTFLSVGFETTTPAGCLSVKAAREDGLDNYSILVANKTMPQAYEALKDSASPGFASSPPTVTPSSISPIPVVVIKIPSTCPFPATFVSPDTICTPASFAVFSMAAAISSSLSIGNPSSITKAQVR